MELSILPFLGSDIEVQNKDTLISLGDEQVLWLDISVADSLFVQILEAIHNLLENVFCHLFCVFMLRLRSQVIEDLHAVNVLHHEVDLVPERVIEVLDSLDDVTVAKLLDDFCFFNLSLTLLFVVLTAQLDGVNGAGLIVYAFADIYACAATLTQLPAKSVFGIEAAGRDTLCLCLYFITFAAQEIHIRLVCLTSPQLFILVSAEERFHS